MVEQTAVHLFLVLAGASAVTRAPLTFCPAVSWHPAWLAFPSAGLLPGIMFVCLAGDHSLIWTDPQSVSQTRIPAGSFGCSHRGGAQTAINLDDTKEESVFWRVRAAVSVTVQGITLSYGCNQATQVICEGRRLSPGAQRDDFLSSCLQHTLTAKNSDVNNMALTRPSHLILQCGQPRRHNSTFI